jgi:hypothetical protein
VSVSGYTNEPFFPTQPFVVNSALAINANTTNLALDVKTYQVSGTVTMNGAAPAASCSGYTAPNVIVTFSEPTLGYVLTATGPCVAGAPFPFSGKVYPGTYKVSISGYTNEPFFPTQPFVVSQALKIP